MQELLAILSRKKGANDVFGEQMVHGGSCHCYDEEEQFTAGYCFDDKTYLQLMDTSIEEPLRKCV